MYRLYIFLILLSFRTSASSDLLDEIILNNSKAKSFGELRKSYEVQGGYLKRSFLPELKFELGYEKFKLFNYSVKEEPYGKLEFLFNIYDGGKDKLSNNVTNKQIELARLNQRVTVKEELLEIHKILNDSKFLSEKLRVVNSTLKEAKNLLVEARKRYSSGLVTTTDILDFEVYIGELEENEDEILHEIENNRLELIPLIGIDISETEFKERVSRINYSIYNISTSFSGHEKLSSIQVESELAGIELQRQRAWWKPKLDVYSGYYMFTMRDREYRRLFDRDDQVIGVRLSMNLFNGLKGSVASSAASYQEQSSKLKAQYMERELERDFSKSVLAIEHAKKIIPRLSKRIALFRNYYKAVIIDYDKGVKNSIDALSALKESFDLSVSLANEERKRDDAMADLMFLSATK